MGMRGFLRKSGDLVATEPFRVIEMLVSVPILLYGLYLLADGDSSAVKGLSVYSYSFDPELNAQIAGTLFVFAGAALLLAARTGVIRARQVSTMAFFFSFLWSILFRTVEIGFLPGSVMLFYVGIVLAGVDFAHLKAREKK